MRTTIILLLITLRCISSCAAQSDSIVRQLLQYEQRYFNATTAQQKSAIAFEKWQYCLQQNVQVGFAKTQAQIDPYYLSIQQQQMYYWNAAVKSMLDADGKNGVEYYNHYQTIQPDTTATTAIVQLLLLANTEDSITTNSPQLQSICNCIQLQQQADSTSRRLNWISYILPGAGMVSKGYWGKGSAALLLFGGSTTAVVALLKNNLYINACCVSFLTVYKLYTGNVILTSKLSTKKYSKIRNAKLKICQQQLQQLLAQHEIGYRF